MNSQAESVPPWLTASVQGDPGGPVLVYLPGVHGDDTLLGSFRAQVGDDLRLVAFTYPVSTDLTLPELAAGVWTQLRSLTDQPIWLLAESFGSQVAWSMLAQAKATPETTLPVQGMILAGGFVRHPWPWAVAAVRWLLGNLSPSVIRGFFRIYPWWACFAYRNAPEILAALPEFVARRRELADQAAMLHRLLLIQLADLRGIARETGLPVYQLTGFWDPVVPWPWVRNWLRNDCPGWKESVVITGADHVALGTGTAPAVATVRRWLGLTPRSKDRQTQ